MKNYFYSHAREGRDYIFGTCKESAIYFYSHAREGRDSNSAWFPSPFKISTHTPARGVTVF